MTKKPAARRFGMVIDLDRCNGCGACMIACAVENNVPPAAAKATDRTGITPMRVYRVSGEGAAEERRTAVFPILCQQCGERTPCVT
ncbi:MAG TPA: molybdopterin oxidoreductase, partial [Solibacterales bacterium]|nr:molybdopterin oxidoreductase [Bryobacterales bacterium]